MHSNKQGSGHVVIIGGSLAGLISARVLSEHFEKVVILERDVLHESPEARKSVPQGNHIHIMLEAGMKALEGLFPGLVQELRGDGADLMDMARDAAWLQAGSWKARMDGGFQSVCVSRPLLEWKVRSRVTALPNVELHSGCTVEELLADTARTRITGVKVKTHDGEKLIEGDLVVDAGGRGSRAPHWLEMLGLGRVEEESVGIDLGYTSRLYERPAGFNEWKALVINGRAPEHRRSGFIANVEGNRWIVSLNGYFGDHAPTDDAGFLEFARKLPTTHLYEYIRNARPLTHPVVHKIATSRWLHYEQLERLPEGFVLLGDAVCALNPVFGQGMTVSTLGAKMLGEHVARARASSGGLNHPGFSHAFQKELSKLVGMCWFLTTTLDLMHPEARGKRMPGLKFLQWSVMNMIDLTSQNAKSCHAFYEVLHMRKGIEGLLQPGFATSLLAYNLKSLLVPREKRANLDVLPAAPGGPTPMNGGRATSAA